MAKKKRKSEKAKKKKKDKKATHPNTHPNTQTPKHPNTRARARTHITMPDFGKSTSREKYHRIIGGTKNCINGEKQYTHTHKHI